MVPGGSEGVADGVSEGVADGVSEGVLVGVSEGLADGVSEGLPVLSVGSPVAPVGAVDDVVSMTSCGCPESRPRPSVNIRITAIITTTAIGAPNNMSGEVFFF